MIYIWLWFGLAFLILTLEIISGSFYLIFVAIGLAGAGIVSTFVNLKLQFFSFCIISLFSLIFCKNRFFKNSDTKDNNFEKLNNHMDIGKILIISDWLDNNIGHVNHNGVQWKVELAYGFHKQNNLYQIIGIRGNRFIVIPKSLSDNR
ncbi:MAG: NfeD family protein [Bordetella sp.]|nr:MAG: NfeD family protein [Bordetella sp.]